MHRIPPAKRSSQTAGLGPEASRSSFSEVADNAAQRLGPCEEKQTVQMVGLGVDFDRETAEPFERAAHVGMEIGANLVRQGSFAIFRRENE